jgi:hypothetical protein
LGESYQEGFKILGILVGLWIAFMMQGAAGIIWQFSNFKALVVYVIMIIFLAGACGIATQLEAVNQIKK